METLLSTAGEPAPFPGAVSDLLPPGAKAGPWVVERELGRGGMGAVYAVVHDEIGKRAALKVVHGRLLGAGFNPDRMLVEARVVNQVGHPNIVDIFETGKLPDGRPYIVMERLEGQSLAQRVDSGFLGAELAIAVLRQICEALIAAHAAGIVHRDLKLDNVFLVDNLEDPCTPKVKLLDWGIAKIVHQDARHTVEGQLVGTPQYLAPEQARGAKVSPKTDVYSLGVMAYELFVEQLPFEAETSAEIMAMHLRATPPPPRDFWPEIPEELDELLLQMLEKAPDDRPTVIEVAARLDAVRGELDRRRRANERGEEVSGVKRLPSSSEAAAAAVVAAPIMVAIPPLPRRTSRRMSADAHAPTAHATWVRPQRWRYVAGGLAIAGCIALFFVSRGGDRVAAAAAPIADNSEVRGTAGAVLAAPTAWAGPGAPGADAVIAADAFQVDAITGEAPGVVVLSPSAGRAERSITTNTAASASRPASKVRAASRPSAVERPSVASPARRGPAAPRRAAKIDPNGTIDPYR